MEYLDLGTYFQNKTNLRPSQAQQMHLVIHCLYSTLSDLLFYTMEYSMF
jgi:hypothetical protein